LCAPQLRIVGLASGAERAQEELCAVLQRALDDIAAECGAPFELAPQVEPIESEAAQAQLRTLYKPHEYGRYGGGYSSGGGYGGGYSGGGGGGGVGSGGGGGQQYSRRAWPQPHGGRGSP
jgi:hypothetical protein